MIKLVILYPFKTDEKVELVDESTEELLIDCTTQGIYIRSKNKEEENVKAN